MRQRYDEPGACSPTLRRLIEQRFSNGVSPASATEWFSASEVAWPAGVHLGPPPQPIHDEMARLTAAGQANLAGQLRARQNTEWSVERRAAKRWEGMAAKWLHEAPQTEQEAARRAERERAAREAAIQRRAVELVTEQEQATRARRVAEAREQAAREMSR